jgi:hypothetical protein
MKPHESTRHRHRLNSTAIARAFAGFVLLSIGANGNAHAAEVPIVARGDAAVTAFSGPSQPGKSPANVQPLDITFIDTTGSSLQVLDLTKLGSAPSGQLSQAAIKLKVTAGEIGQVFGVALAEGISGEPPDIYAAATSLFGLQIVEQDTKGNLVRLVKGSAGARWMPGQFGLERGGGPGSIWKIDGKTGAVSLFSTITSGNVENAGPGLGGIAFDAVSRQFFVSNLETGLIHRLDMSGRELGVFDHGRTARGKTGLPQVADDPTTRMDIRSPKFSIEDPVTWGYADAKRRVVAVAVENGRLFYSIAEGPTIWSVGLLADGSFADDARFEIDVTGTPDGSPITAMTFDASGRLYLSQRGRTTGSYDYETFARPDASVVYRYAWDDTAKAWTSTPDEFAIGLSAPHRATNGGLALSYGYDSAGLIDVGRCGETLWTTGENLAGDAKGYIDGLQGSSLSNAQPASVSRPRSGTTALQGDFGPIESDLTAPAGARIVDYDDYAQKARMRGPIGAVAIYAPCDQIPSERASAEPPRPPVPTTPPEPLPGAAISKVCLPAPLGGIIKCTITLTNTGFTLLGPVGFADAATILAGPQKGAPVLIQSATPDGMDWACSPTPTTTLACSLPPIALPPQTSRSVDVLVDTGPLVAAGNSGFENCASLNLPWTGIACADGRAEIIVKKTAPASCLPGAACTFTVTLNNVGTAPFAGDVLMTDSMFVDGGGAPVAAPITAIVPPLGCAPEPAALPFSCAAPVSLLAGQSKVYSITATMPAAPPNYWARNCIAASAAGQPAPMLPPVPGPNADLTSCAWVPVGAPPPLANLRITKSPLTCHKQGPDTVRCNYEIELLNNGPSPSTSLITFTETVPPSSTLASIAAPWSCIGGPPGYTCTTAAAPVIAPGDHLTIPVSIDLDRAPLEAAKCWAPNNIAITAPAGGTNQNFDAADDTSIATADAAWIRFDEGGPLELVLCDPTNLATKKVANGDCENTASGTKCSYDITLTNTGPDPFKGQIDIKDEFGTAPSKVEFGGDWACGGAGATRTCSHAPFELLKGQSVSLPVTATFPKSSQCSMRNTATMVFPPANTRWNGSGADDSSSAFAKVVSPECERKPTCERPAEGEIRTASGDCACERGFARDRKGRCVKTEPEEPATPPTRPACEPGPNEYRTSAGECVCKTGYRREEGRCIAAQPDPVPLCKPGPNEIRTTNNECVCREGYERDRNRRCVPEKAETCPAGRTGTPPNCKQQVCDEGETGTWPNCRPITCPEGFTGRPPRCKPITCPAGMVGTPPNCKPVDKPRCPLGYMGTPPNCKPMTCPPGTTGIPPLCKTIKCPPGTRGTPPNCKPIEQPKCPPGFRGTPPKCFKLEIKCPTGQIRDTKTRKCVAISRPQPKPPASEPVR